MSARDRWPTNRTLADDPARQKSRYLGGAPGVSDYFARIQRYNSALYAPADTRPGVEQMPTIAPLSTNRTSAGWQQGRDPLAIAARYGTRGTPVLNNTITAMRSFGTVRGPQPTGAAGPTGEEIDTQYPSASRPAVEDQSTMAAMPGSGPKTNSIQRWAPEEWKSAGGSQRSWNKAGVEMGIRPAIDARARPSARNYSPEPVEFQRPGSTALGTGAPVAFKNVGAGGHKWQPRAETSNMQLPY